MANKRVRGWTSGQAPLYKFFLRTPLPHPSAGWKAEKSVLLCSKAKLCGWLSQILHFDSLKVDCERSLTFL